MLKTLVIMTDISWKAKFSSTSRGSRCAEHGRFWLTAVGLIRRSLATISFFKTKHLPQKVSTNLCFRQTKQFPFNRVPFCTKRISIWMRDNIKRRLQSCLSPSRSFPLLESLLADWPMKSQMRLTNQTKVSFVRKHTTDAIRWISSDNPANIFHNYLNNRKRFPCLHSLSRILPTPRVFISGYANTEKNLKFSIAFIKQLSREKKSKALCMALIKREIRNSRKILSTKFCSRNQLLFCKKMLCKIRIFLA